MVVTVCTRFARLERRSGGIRAQRAVHQHWCWAEAGRCGRGSDRSRFAFVGDKKALDKLGSEIHAYRAKAKLLGF
jgi:hypothetical protein